MTQKDFELIAEVLAKLKLPPRTLAYIAISFADKLEADNPRFKRGVFLKACGLNDAWRAALT